MTSRSEKDSKVFSKVPLTPGQRRTQQNAYPSDSTSNLPGEQVSSCTATFYATRTITQLKPEISFVTTTSWARRPLLTKTITEQITEMVTHHLTTLTDFLTVQSTVTATRDPITVTSLETVTSTKTPKRCRSTKSPVTITKTKTITRPTTITLTNDPITVTSAKAPIIVTKVKTVIISTTITSTKAPVTLTKFKTVTSVNDPKKTTPTISICETKRTPITRFISTTSGIATSGTKNSMFTPSDDCALYKTIGVAAGGSFGLVLSIFVVYLFSRWMKERKREIDY